jgi:hypothetical protein
MHATKGESRRRRYVPAWKALFVQALLAGGTWRRRAVGEGCGVGGTADVSEGSEIVIDSVAEMILDV